MGKEFAVETPEEMCDLMCNADLRVCPVCGKEHPREDMTFTYDCHGIPMRLVCYDCYEKVMAKGYDGEYYTEADECLDEDY